MIRAGFTLYMVTIIEIYSVKPRRALGVPRLGVAQRHRHLRVEPAQPRRARHPAAGERVPRLRRGLAVGGVGPLRARPAHRHLRMDGAVK